MDKSFSEIAKIVLVGALAFWLIWALAGILLLLGGAPEKAGLFGDFFGGFNALVSVLGFCAVIYSLERQHQESRESEERHAKNQRIQQELFTQDVQLRLFEKRVVLYDNLDNFLSQASANQINPEMVKIVNSALSHTKFLFPKNEELIDFVFQIAKTVSKQRNITSKYPNLHVNAIPIEQHKVTIFETMKWFAGSRPLLRKLFSHYATVSPIFTSDEFQT